MTIQVALISQCRVGGNNVALQGTIDTFPLTDVLALLETSAKSGQLTLTGTRGSGQIWLDDGSIHGGTLDRDDTLTADRLLFELLRFEEGSFEFSSVEVAEFPKFESSPLPIKACIESAAQMLEQWERIESIVPSILHRISLAPELPVAEMTVDSELWSFLVAVSSSETVADAAQLLRMDNYECSAVIASLVEQQLAVISEPAGSIAPLGESAPESEPAPAESIGGEADVDDSTLIEDLQQEEAMWDEPANNFPERFPIDDLLLDDSDDNADPWGAAGSDSDDSNGGDTQAAQTNFVGLPEVESVPLDSAAGGPHQIGSGLRDWDEMVNMEPLKSDGVNSPEETADEVLRQMSKLSPKAAEAIAAALGSAADQSQESTAPDDTTGLGPVSFLDSF